MKQNGLMMQCFEWYMPADGSLWKKLAKDAAKLKTMGVTGVWLPPAYKGAAGKDDVGYGVYDMYDLGEFDQKGTVATKYGTKEEYLDAIKALHEKGIQVYADVVLNHRIGADETELIAAEEFNAISRNQMVGNKRIIKGWTKFTFPGRKNKYSKFKWNWTHFDGIDWDQQATKNAVYRFVGKKWDEYVSDENGNYDYLMGADVDFSNQEVIDELYRWGSWYMQETGVDGVRLDAVKHINNGFYKGWLPVMREVAGKDLFAVGEYWHWDINELTGYLESVDREMALFDVPLHFRFHDASKAHGSYDLRNLVNGTLTALEPTNSVTFVDNHDTQPGQALQSWVEDWFKPMAYAFILLREQGYPCLFYGDYYGIEHDKFPAMKKALDVLLKARKTLAYGTQHDYFDDANVVGWTREGDDKHKNSGLAVIMSDGTGGTKRMYVGKQHAGEFFSDLTGNAKYNIKIDDDGCGEFYVNRAAVAVWAKKKTK